MATPVSTSADVVRNVVAILMHPLVADVAVTNDGSGGTARVFHGEEYLDTNDTPPRYVFVLGEDGGEIGGPLQVGAREVASITETISVHIWGGGPSDDARTDDAKARAHLILNCLKAGPVGRLKGKVLTRETSPKILKFGEEAVVRAAYSWPVPYNDAVFAAAYALAPVPPLSPANPDEPNGPTGNEFFTTPITLANGRPS